MQFFKRALTMCVVIAILATSALALNLNASALIGAGAPSATNPEMILGIDLSYWNVSQNSLIYSQVDFAKLKSEGCDFAILRLGYETSTSSGIKIDPAFNEFYKRARAAGMNLGLYVYSYALTYNAAKNDAQYVMDYIEARGMYFEYPIYLDMETEAQTSASASTMENICLGWCEILENNGYYPGVYAPYWVYNKLSSSFKSRYDFWVPAYKGSTINDAQYTHTSQPSVLGGKPYATGYSMWQYSSVNYYNGDYVYKGVYKANGTSYNPSLDLNVCYKNYPAIIKENGYNNCTPSESASQKNLREIINNSFDINHNDYSVDGLEAIRMAEWEGTTLLNTDGSTDAQFDEAYNKIAAAINNKVKVLSLGKSYTVSPNPRSDIYADDGIRLTDGKRGYHNGGDITDNTHAYYAGLGKETEIVVDLGSSQMSDTYTIYLAAGMWGVPLLKKNLFNLEVFVSNDLNSGFVSLGSTNDIVHVGGPNVADEDWTTYTVTLKTASRSSRYVKFVVKNNDCNGNVWVDEIEVTNGGSAILGGAYINGMNSKIYSGDCHIFTPAFGTITTSTANHAYTTNIIAKYNATYDRFVVTQVSEGIGVDTPDITLADDEILIAAHCWEGEGITDPVAGSYDNTAIVARAKVGDIIEFSGINIPYAFTTAGAHISFHGSTAILDNEPAYHVEGEWETLDDGSQVLKCAKCGEVLETKEKEPEPTLSGDMNLDGKVNMFDYLIIKSIYFKKYEPTEDEKKRADLNGDSKINIFDYLIVKDVCFQ